MCPGGHRLVTGFWGGTLVMHCKAGPMDISVTGLGFLGAAHGAPCQERLTPRVLWRGGARLHQGIDQVTWSNTSIKCLDQVI